MIEKAGDLWRRPEPEDPFDTKERKVGGEFKKED